MAAPVEVPGDGAYGTRPNRWWFRDDRIRLVAPWCGKGRGRVIGRILQPADRARRAKVEGRQAELVWWHGLPKARYIRRAKVQLKAYLTAAWANLTCLARLLRVLAPQPATAKGPRLPGRPRNPRKWAPGGPQRLETANPGAGARGPENLPAGVPEASPRTRGQLFTLLTLGLPPP